MQALKGLPPFSATLSRLMASLAGDDVSFSELGDLIEKDTVVSGNILGMVNSALYSRRGAVTSVRHGLSLLGTNRIRNLVLSLQVSGLWSNARCPQELSIARFNQHAAAVAMLSDFLAQHAQVDYPEGAFLGGLLHDVGQLILVLGLPADFRQILAVHRQTGRTSPSAMRLFRRARWRHGRSPSRFGARWSSITMPRSHRNAGRFPWAGLSR